MKLFRENRQFSPQTILLKPIWSLKVLSHQLSPLTKILVPIEDLYGVATQNSCICTENNGQAGAFLEVRILISTGSKTEPILHPNWGKPVKLGVFQDRNPFCMQIAEEIGGLPLFACRNLEII